MNLYANEVDQPAGPEVPPVGPELLEFVEQSVNVNAQHWLVSLTATEGWDSWTSWSLCDADGLQYRMRNCLTNNPGPGLCQGRSREERLCIPFMLNTEGQFKRLD